MTADIRESQRQDFEQQVVYRVLRRAGLIGRLRALKDELESRSGSRRLTLKWLSERYPGFPLRLGAVLLPDGAEVRCGDVFMRFTNTAFFQSYKRWLEEQGLDDRRDHVGVVFNVIGTTFVLNNLPGDQPKGSSRLVRVVGKPPVTLYLEALEGMLCRIGPGWALEQNMEQLRG
jgi:hypothetical protein